MTSIHGNSGLGLSWFERKGLLSWTKLELHILSQTTILWDVQYIIDDVAGPSGSQIKRIPNVSSISLGGFNKYVPDYQGDLLYSRILNDFKFRTNWARIQKYVKISTYIVLREDPRWFPNITIRFVMFQLFDLFVLLKQYTSILCKIFCTFNGETFTKTVHVFATTSLEHLYARQLQRLLNKEEE